MIKPAKILLVITGSIASYKALELARELTKRGHIVTTILSKGGQQFITPLAITSLTGKPVYTDLFSLKEETEMGHIRLSRESDVVVVAPASANIIAKMANGFADDLASATLLAANRKIIVAPAMNVEMWNNPATQRNISQIAADGKIIIAPENGEMACGEVGDGRLCSVDRIIKTIELQLTPSGILNGKKVLVTAGPTFEPIDSVRFIGNYSSGKQGYAIAEAFAASGADVTLISGPTALSMPPNIKSVQVQTAMEMLNTCLHELPADIAICAAAVADWSVKNKRIGKIKKEDGKIPNLEFTENPDILATISNLPDQRPNLVIGFAAESGNVLTNGKKKLLGKNCDAIVANDIKNGNIFGSNSNHAILITRRGNEDMGNISKFELANRLVQFVAGTIKTKIKEAS